MLRKVMTLAPRSATGGAAPATTSTPSSSATSSGAPAQYANTVQVDPRMTLYYTVRGQDMDVKAVYAGKVGWLAVGVCWVCVPMFDW